MADAPRILFAGGGTGGHVYPAIAIADAVRRIAPDAVIEFAGTRAKMEWEAVPKAGYKIHPITISGFHRGQPLRNVSLPLKIAKSLIESRRLVAGFDPHVAVGTGGYVSGPVLFAASLAGKPVIVQEQNAYAGMTNKLLGRVARHIHIAFVEAKDYLPASKCLFSGNPTRHELRDVDRGEGRRHYEMPDDAFVVVVLGGSLGSRAMNEALAANIDALLANEKVYVVWQTGKQYFAEMKNRVSDHPRLRLLQYVDRMDLTYAAADLAVCRAGAITCSELMVTGTPSVLIPSPNVAEDHQTHNAKSMAGAGAAVMVPESEMKERLMPVVQRLRSDPDQLREMKESALKIARADAADTIARDVLTVGGFPEPK